MGDFGILFFLNVKIRLQFALAFNGRRDSYDIITGLPNEDFELQEASYFSVYSIFKEDEDLEDIFVTTIEDFDLYNKSEEYDNMYDREKVLEFNKRLNMTS